MMLKLHYNILDRWRYAAQFWIEYRKKFRGHYFSILIVILD
jgi:hypothetical protein